MAINTTNKAKVIKKYLFLKSSRFGQSFKNSTNLSIVHSTSSLSSLRYLSFTFSAFISSWPTIIANLNP